MQRSLLRLCPPCPPFVLPQSKGGKRLELFSLRLEKILILPKLAALQISSKATKEMVEALQKWAAGVRDPGWEIGPALIPPMYTELLPARGP